ncbi:MAG: pilus assembly protein TadG-related protein [Firmicutes bacterium]|nr:pilus assembly protein TadG-related protein [Bacillota bacterium]
MRADERGNSLIITAIILPVVLMLLVLVVDLGIIHLTRSQVQMASDAGSLAAVAVEDDEIVISGFSVNNGLELAFRVEINESKAKTRAREVVAENLQRVKNIEWSENDFTYRKVDSDSYYVEVKFEAQSLLLGSLFSGMGYERIMLTVDSEAKANLAP